METTQVKKRNLLSIFLIFFVDNFGFSLVFSLFAPLILNQNFGFIGAQFSDSSKNLLLAFLFASFPLAQFFGAPLIGDFADHQGRRKAFIMTLSGSTFGFILSVLAILSHSFVLLIISRIVSGFFAGNLGVCLASIADMAHTERLRGRCYGLVTTVTGISWVSAMIIGSFLGDPTVSKISHPILPFLITSLLNLAALFFVIFTYDETRILKEKPFSINIFTGVKNVLTAFNIREVRLLYLIYFMLILAWGSILQWFSPFSIEVFSKNPEEIASILMIIGLAFSLSGGIFNYFLLRRIRSYKIVLISLLFMIAFLVVSTFLKSFDLFSLMMAFGAALSGLIMTNMLNLISMTAPYHMQGKIMGLSQSVVAFAWIVAPLMIGYVANINIQDVFILAPALLAIAFILLSIRNHLNKNGLSI